MFVRLIIIFLVYSISRIFNVVSGGRTKSPQMASNEMAGCDITANLENLSINCLLSVIQEEMDKELDFYEKDYNNYKIFLAKSFFFQMNLCYNTAMLKCCVVLIMYTSPISFCLTSYLFKSIIICSS